MGPGGSYTSAGIIGPVTIAPGTVPVPGGLGEALGASSLAGNSGLSGLSGIQGDSGTDDNRGIHELDVDDSLDHAIAQLDYAISDVENDLQNVPTLPVNLLVLE